MFVHPQTTCNAENSRVRERSGKFSNSASKSEHHVLLSKRNINFIKRGGSLKAWLASPHLPTRLSVSAASSSHAHLQKQE